MTDTYALGENTYVREAIRIAKEQINKHKIVFPTNKRQSEAPFTSLYYWPKLETTEKYNPDLYTLFQNFIGMLRWMSRLERIDILHEESLLSQYLALSRIGHLL